MINNPTFRPYRDYWLHVDVYDVHVSYYSPYSPMVITGSGFGDAIPPDPEEMEYEIYVEGVRYYPDDIGDPYDLVAIEQAIREEEDK